VNVAPSVNNAKKQGIRVDRREYPAGVGGVKLSLQKIAQYIREGRLDPAVRGWAGDALIAAGSPTSIKGQAQAILTAFKKQTTYAPDPVGAEYNVSAAGTLCLRPGFCVRVFDCDDGVIAISSALMSIGIPVRVVKQTFGSGDQEHVILEFQDENGNWLPLDPSTDRPIGQKEWATSEFRMDPMNASMIGLTGVPDAEYVGVGNPTRRLLGLGAGGSSGDLPSTFVTVAPFDPHNEVAPGTTPATTTPSPTTAVVVATIQPVDTSLMTWIVIGGVAVFAYGLWSHHK
jgi:hypothetical protein